MAQTTWKLVVTSLAADGEAREAVVDADNWLSALRLARKQLKEEGGVPPGASCVMSASGEVTILDGAQRRRYVLTRGGASIPPPAAGPSASQTAAPVAAKNPSMPAVAPVGAPVAGSSAAAGPVAIAPVANAPTPASAPATGPISAPAAAAPAAGSPLSKKTTMAYSPAESAAVRAQMAAAQPKPATANDAPATVATERPPAASAPAATPAKTGASNLVSPIGNPLTAGKPAPASALNAPVAAAPAPTQTAPAPAQAAPAKLGTGTLSYEPEEAAAARAQLLAAQGAPANISKSLPEPLTAKPARKSTTMAYSPEESAQVRAQLQAAQAAQGLSQAKPAEQPATANAQATADAFAPTDRPPAPGAAQPAAAPAKAAAPKKTTMAYSPEESAAMRAQLLAAQPAAAAPAPQPAAPANPAAAMRKNTMAYSPQETAAARAQLQAAQAEQNARAAAPAPAASAPAASATAASAPAAPAPAASAPAAPAQTRKSSTVAYMESPFIGGVLVALSTRAEDPSPGSPISYRERSYYVGDNIDRSRIEAAVRGEFERIRMELGGRARGQFVNLAVFDHAFEGKPLRPPIATLVWKDWRGAPAYWQGTPSTAPEAWTGGGQEPVRTSFVPPSESQTAAPVAVMGAPEAQQVPAAPQPPAAQPPAPSMAFYTPVAQVEPRPFSNRESTGEQDRRLAVAFEAVQDLYFMATPVEGLDFAVKLLADLVPCEAVSGCIYDINTDEFRFVAATGPGADQRRADAVPSTSGLLSVAMHSHRESFVVADAGNDARFEDSVDGRPGITPRNLAYLPLQKGDVWLGVIQLINRENPRGFSDGDLAVACYVAAQVTDFLQARRQASARRRN